jgi:hypothetical protein
VRKTFNKYHNGANFETEMCDASDGMGSRKKGLDIHNALRYELWGLEKIKRRK